MSNQLYSYISELIVEYFRSQQIQPGDRFNLYFEDKSDIVLLYDALRSFCHENIGECTYIHPEGGETYTTFYIIINETKVIIASGASASDSYLTMLRNKVSDQDGVFEGAAILILFSGKLDSLIGGSGSLIKEGMPLHYTAFKEKIANDIRLSSSLSTHDKRILEFILDKKTKSVVEDNNSIFDFGQIINVLQKGTFDVTDFRMLGLFPHAELSSMDGNIFDDLENNYREYEWFENTFTNGDPLTELDGKFPDSAINRFIKEGWQDTDFATLQKLKEKEQEKEPPIIQSVDSEYLFDKPWVTRDGQTVSKRRNLNIVTFNPSLTFPYNIYVKFDQYIKVNDLKFAKSDHIAVSSSGYKIVIEVKDFSKDLFYLVEYVDGETKKKYNIKLLLLPFGQNLLANFDTNFLLRYAKSGISYLYIKHEDVLTFNPGAEIQLEEILEIDKDYIVSEDQQLKLHIDPSIIQEELIHFSLTHNDIRLPLAINFDIELPKPITGLEVWKTKRTSKESFRFLQEGDKIKLVLKNEERTVSLEYRNNLILERQLIDSDGYAWESRYGNKLIIHELDIYNEVREKFDALRNKYRELDGLPSLTFLNEELAVASLEYVQAYIDQLEAFQENVPLSEKQKQLFWLGVIFEIGGEEKIKFTPLHPLNVAYQLLVSEKLGDESIHDAILKKLSTLNLLPNIEIRKGQTYIPIESDHSPEWLYYTAYLNTKQAVAKSFTADLIRDKIRDFTVNFDFLFDQSKTAPLGINVINLGDCKEVLQGIFRYYKRYLDRHEHVRPQDLLPIEVNIYGSENVVTKFEELAFYEKIGDIEKELEIDLKTTHFEREDLLNAFWDKVSFFSRKIPEKGGRYEYAHLAFFQFDVAKTDLTYDEMSRIKTGVSFNGLLAEVSSTPAEESYRTGFGTVDLPSEESALIKLTCLLNAFARVYAKGDPYEKNKALCTTIDFGIKSQLNQLYEAAQWVTYIDPKVDLDFFKDNKDLVIIHYSDQYSNSSTYDAITVSKKTKEYEFIVKEFLEKHHVNFDPDIDCVQIINLFNAINGEWLLKLIKQNSQFPREKLSLLSGIKTALTYLYSADVIWVPISLEEILRITGNVGLKTADGLFSAKNLGVLGLLSDDLLFIGLEMYNDELLLHFYPIELKIGKRNLVDKGIEQGKKTANLIQEHLTKEGFTSEFYKNFFAKIVLASAKRLKLFNVWDGQNWDVIINQYRQRLLNNDFVLSNRFDSIIGQFGVFYFGSDVVKRQIDINDGFLRFDLREADGYNFLVKSVDQLIELFHYTETTIDRDKLFAGLFSNANKLIYTKVDAGVELGAVPMPFVQDVADEPLVDHDAVGPSPILQDDKGDVNTSSDINTEEGIAVLFGTDLNHNVSVVWEPNNTDKVMHTNTGIIGTMGTGKTQFTKSLITQLVSNSHKNIGQEKLGVLIFDYKGDYIKDDFVQKTGARVLLPYRLPYNPLALDVTQYSKPMLPLHTANDLKETIANAFNLGNVQKQRLRDVIVQAYENKGINKADRESWTKMPPTLGDVCDLYLGNEDNSQDSLYAAISNLSEFEIFEPDASKARSLYSLIEGVVVINLSGYDESIQNLIVAITLDAFYTQMQRNGHSDIKGGMRQLKKMILVDEADNFLSKNFASIRKILKEGREFGVGTILSTQFLSHFATSETEYSNYILTWVIHRVNEIKTKEVDSLFSLSDKATKENLIKTIKNLEKHRSIVNLAGSEPILIKDKAFWELL